MPEKKLTAVDRIDGRKRDKRPQRVPRRRDAVHREGDGGDDGHGVLPGVDQVREHVARVAVAAEALQEAPDGGQRGEEAEEPRLVGAALRGVLPGVCVEAEEEFDVLEGLSGVVQGRAGDGMG